MPEGRAVGLALREGGEYQDAGAAFGDVLARLVDALLVCGPALVTLLEELADALAGPAELGVDVPPSGEGGVLVAAALLDEALLALLVVVLALPVGQLLLRGGGRTRLFFEESERRFS